MESKSDNIGFKGKIFCLVGKSASGKDSMYSRVMARLADDGYEVKPIVTYTTRPKRSGEQDGKEYIFISEDELNALESENRVIEKRDYDTQYGIWSYATVEDGQVRGGASYFVIATPEACASLRAHYGEEHVKVYYLSIDDGVRLMRALTREMQQQSPKYDEMCRRFLSDMEDFAEIDALVRNDDENAPKVFVNREADACAESIAQEIENEIGGV